MLKRKIMLAGIVLAISLSIMGCNTNKSTENIKLYRKPVFLRNFLCFPTTFLHSEKIQKISVEIPSLCGYNIRMNIMEYCVHEGQNEYLRRGDGVSS